MHRPTSVVPTILLSLAAAFGAFSYWGLYTDAGRHSFDEMDGLYPFFAGGLGVILFLLFLVLVALRNKG